MWGQSQTSDVFHPGSILLPDKIMEAGTEGSYIYIRVPRPSKSTLDSRPIRRSISGPHHPAVTEMTRCVIIHRSVLTHRPISEGPEALMWHIHSTDCVDFNKIRSYLSRLIDNHQIVGDNKWWRMTWWWNNKWTVAVFVCLLTWYKHYWPWWRSDARTGSSMDVHLT